jgi:hypothetical protein
MELDQTRFQNSRVFHSTPRKLLVRRFLISAVLFVIWISIMNVADQGLYVFRFLGLFLLVATSALLVLTLRPPCTVMLDAENFTGQRGGKKTVIPWSALGQDDSRLKLEEIFGWQRLNIAARVEGKKSRFSLDNIFGVGLPVSEIFPEMQERIKRDPFFSGT